MSAKPHIVFLDAGSIGDDIPWPDFSALGTVTRHEYTKNEDVEERIREADIVLTNKVPLSAKKIAGAPRLRYIGVLATGFNIVDGGAAALRGIPLCNVPDYSSNSVVQQTFALMLALASDVCALSTTVREGGWIKSTHFCFWHKPLHELDGKTFGVVGFGSIGGKAAALAHHMGMNVLAHAPRPKEAPDYAPFAFVSLEELFSRSDVISLHCPLTQENTGMVNARLLSLVKPGAFLINTARGALVVEEDLAKALAEGRLAGAGLDVLGREPMVEDSPLRTAPNCIITPHVAWATVEARGRLMDIAHANIRAFLEGRPVNVCNGV